MNSLYTSLKTPLYTQSDTNLHTATKYPFNTVTLCKRLTTNCPGSAVSLWEQTLSHLFVAKFSRGQKGILCTATNKSAPLEQVFSNVPSQQQEQERQRIHNELQSMCGRVLHRHKAVLRSFIAIWKCNVCIMKSNPNVIHKKRQVTKKGWWQKVSLITSVCLK